MNQKTMQKKCTHTHILILNPKTNRMRWTDDGKQLNKSKSRRRKKYCIHGIKSKRKPRETLNDKKKHIKAKKK